MIERGLIIDEPWISMILNGEKTWEMRTTASKVRGPIALIKKGSKQVVGTAELVDCLSPLSFSEFARHERLHRIPAARHKSAWEGGWQVPWVLRKARRLNRPVAYAHPSGAVIWVKLEPSVVRAVQAQMT